MAEKKKVLVVKAEILPDEDATPELSLVPVFDRKKDMLEVTGNFESVKAYLTARRDEIAKTKFSSKDMETVVKYKKEAQGYRIQLDTKEKDAKKRYFNGPKDILSGQIASLQAIVSVIEAQADKIIDAENAKRESALTQVLDIYKADFQEEYKLSPANLALIQYKPAYYNKTAKEAATKADIEAQFKELKAKETARVAGEKLIRKTCGVEKLLDVEGYIRRLDTEELGNIIESIEREAARLSGAKVAAAEDEPEEAEAEITAEVDGDSPDKVVIGVVGAVGELLTSGSDFPDKTKKIILDVVYPIDMGDALTALFKELARYKIIASVHKESVF